MDIRLLYNIVFLWGFLASDMLQIDVNACVTAKEVDRVSLYNGRMLGESYRINSIFVECV